MANERVLVVEDEEDIQELVQFNLAKDGYRVAAARSGEEALKKIRADPPDLVLLDLMLPGLNGLEVCRVVRADPKTKSIPIVMITAKGEEADIVTGLELGADDYLPKPFSPRVLLARLRAVLRRRESPRQEQEGPLELHGVSIHPGRREVRVNGEAVELTHTEFRLLHFLALRPGWVFTRNQIVEAVRGIDYPVTERAVDVQVVGLRKKMGEAGKLVETVRGVGYRFKE
jgi:two-component system phosphate regulon response regulator PhoB